MFIIIISQYLLLCISDTLSLLVLSQCEKCVRGGFSLSVIFPLSIHEYVREAEKNPLCNLKQKVTRLTPRLVEGN